MSELLRIPSFHVEGFRAIRRLTISDLKRVNLFVGQNNAGKTSLLEALRLFLHRNARTLSAVVVEIVTAHVSFRSLTSFAGRSDPSASDLQGAMSAVEALFHGSFDSSDLHPIYLALGEDDSATLRISVPWSTDNSTTDAPTLIDPKEAVLHLQSERKAEDLPIDWFLRRIPLRRSDKSLTVTIPSSGVDAFEARVMWDSLVVSGQESVVEDALRILIPDLERVILVGEQRSRSVLCKLRGLRKPIPILSMGDGTNRIFGFAVALAHARGGALLIDEIENGLHHSIQPNVWDTIFALASSLDVQVFASTHSWDAVVAFQAAAGRSSAAGMLYRLERDSEEGIYVETYTEEEVAIAAEHQVEVR